jgi:hypothetical protein
VAGTALPGIGVPVRGAAGDALAGSGTWGRGVAGPAFAGGGAPGSGVAAAALAGAGARPVLTLRTGESTVAEPESEYPTPIGPDPPTPEPAAAPGQTGVEASRGDAEGSGVPSTRTSTSSKPRSRVPARPASTATPSTWTRTSRSPVRPPRSVRKESSSAWYPVESTVTPNGRRPGSTSPARETRASPRRTSGAWTQPPGPGVSTSVATSLLETWASSKRQASALRVTSTVTSARGSEPVSGLTSSRRWPVTFSHWSEPGGPASQNALPELSAASTRWTGAWARTSNKGRTGPTTPES